jgi:hypothetical protein
LSPLARARPCWWLLGCRPQRCQPGLRATELRSAHGNCQRSQGRCGQRKSSASARYRTGRRSPTLLAQTPTSTTSLPFGTPRSFPWRSSPRKTASWMTNALVVRVGRTPAVHPAEAVALPARDVHWLAPSHVLVMHRAVVVGGRSHSPASTSGSP